MHEQELQRDGEMSAAVFPYYSECKYRECMHDTDNCVGNFLIECKTSQNHTMCVLFYCKAVAVYLPVSHPPRSLNITKFTSKKTEITFYSISLILIRPTIICS